MSENQLSTLDLVIQDRDKLLHEKNLASAREYRLRLEIAKLKAERDDARKECCILNTTYRPNGMIDKHPHDIAKERNWGCFDNWRPKE